jgi:adenine-specific DNA-methyltransferase
MQLSNKYKREDFINFLENDFLSDFKKDIRPVNSDGLATIQKAYTLGRSKSLGLEVFEICLNGSINKRISLTKDAFSIMKSTANFNALAIFYTVENEEWRLSLMTLNSEKTEKGSAKISYSNPKRYSYLLGKNAKINTPTKYLITKNKVIDFNDLKSRFSLEVVNKDFYNEISSLFMKLVGGTVMNGKKKVDYLPLLKLPLVDEKSRVSLEFAVRLMGRIIFCWFLREKQSQSGKSLIPKELLSLDAINSNNDYYHKILEPIFFEVLNRPAKIRKDFYRTIFFESIPYLNGGLFYPHEDDFFSSNEKKQVINHDTVIIPDDWFKELFSVLETYNFTIDENISFDEELSIDPEMLGRIFENLLAEINPETGESARKSTGSYYTPRVIVDYMVGESIYSYLKTQTKIDENKLRSIISYDFNDDIEEIISEDEKNKIIDALERVKILDPACGSGAYPMGALQKIVFMLQQVDVEGKAWFKKQIQNVSPEIKRVIEREFDNKNFDYIRKLGIIRKNIYGIDIQPIATEISRLRCFLTLIVDESIHDNLENRGIEPLPNLDFKFVTANSLIGLPKISKNNQASLFEDRSGIEELKELRDMFFNASGTEKEELKLQFVQAQKRMFERIIKTKTAGMADLTGRLTSWDPFGHKVSTWFDSEWMFGIKDGFDIVIGNPPYGFRDILSPEEKVYFRKIEKIEFSSGDSAELFCRKCFDKLTIDDGILTFIIPKKSLYGDAWEGYRRNYWIKYSLKYLIDFSKAFENVLLEMNVFGLVKNYKSNDIKCGYLKKDNTILEFAIGEKKDVFLKNSTAQIYKLIAPFLWEKIQNKKTDEHLVDGKLGLAIGTDFYSDKNTGDKLLKGIDIARWKIKAYRWLKNKSKLNWENAREFLKPKVISQRLVAHIENPVPHIKITACYDEEGIIITNTLMSFELKNKLLPKFWLAYLNSTFVSWYAYNFIYARAIRSMDFYNFYIQQIPIPKQISEDKNKQKLFIDVVDKILAITKTDDYLVNSIKQAKVREYEKQIDQMVYKLYDLSSEEIKIVESSEKN